MKRKHKQVYERPLYRHYGLFIWRQCSCCKEDFRREKGFRFLVGPFFNGMRRWLYLCGSCAPEDSAAHKFARSDQWHSLRPRPPQGIKG